MITLAEYLRNISIQCKIRSEYPYNDPEDMHRCLIETHAKLDAVVALMAEQDAQRAAPQPKPDTLPRDFDEAE